jgi:regulatory protein
MLKEKIKEKALKFISRRMRTEKETRDFLGKLDCEEVVMEKIIDDFKISRFVDDFAYARAYIHDKINLNSFGRGRLTFELKRKGIKNEIVSRVINEEFSLKSEEEIAFKLAKKRFPEFKRDLRIKRKFLGFLKNKGFSFSTIEKVLNDGRFSNN